MDRPNAVRVAFRLVHGATPEAAATIEAYLDKLEARVAALSAEDPYRSLVLDLHETMVRVDSGVLADVARIEVGRLSLAKAEAEKTTAQYVDRTERRNIARALVTPHALAIIVPLLLSSGGIGGMVVRYFFPSATPISETVVDEGGEP